jgi:hypothetical protein
VHKPEDMAANRPIGAYVPPHVRKMMAAAGPTNDVELGDWITPSSPQTSNKTQLEKLAAGASS